MKKVLVALCLCSLLFAFAGCSGAVPVATEDLNMTYTQEPVTEESILTEQLPADDGLPNLLNSWQYYPISQLPWLERFSSAQCGQGDLSRIDFYSYPEGRYSIYDGKESGDLSSFWVREYADLPFSEITSHKTTGGLNFTYSFVNGKAYFVADLPQGQVLCGDFVSTQEAAKKQVEEMLSTVKVTIDHNYFGVADFEANKHTIGGELQEVTFEVNVENDLKTVHILAPAQWVSFRRSFGQEELYYAENGYPVLYPHRVYAACIYQAVTLDSGFLVAEGEQWITKASYMVDDRFTFVEEGATDSGLPYVLYAYTVDDYHAIEYRGFVQADSNTVVSVMICVDIDNTGIVEEMLRSVY